MSNARPITEWLWPVEMIGDMKPVISDGFNPNGRGGKGHFGGDIMFRRPSSGALSPHEYARHFWVPNGRTWVIAPDACTVKIAGSNSTGFRVQLDMGVPKGETGTIYCYATHMSRLIVRAGERLARGQRIGVVSYNPLDGAKGLNHLHFEIWAMWEKAVGVERPGRPLDPGPYSRSWSYKREGGGDLVADLSRRPDPFAVARESRAASEPDGGAVDTSGADTLLVGESISDSAITGADL